MKTGINQELTLLGFGVDGDYGINQQLKQVMKILKNDSFNQNHI